MKSFILAVLLFTLALCHALPVEKTSLEAVDAGVAVDPNFGHERVARSRFYGGYPGYYGGGYPGGGFGGFPGIGYGSGFGGASASANSQAFGSGFGGGFYG